MRRAYLIGFLAALLVYTVTSAIRYPGATVYLLAILVAALVLAYLWDLPGKMEGMAPFRFLTLVWLSSGIGIAVMWHQQAWVSIAIWGLLIISSTVHYLARARS